MFKQTVLSGLWNTELCDLVDDPIRMHMATPDDYEELVGELSERLRAISYMVEATLDGQDS